MSLFTLSLLKSTVHAFKSFKIKLQNFTSNFYISYFIESEWQQHKCRNNNRMQNNPPRDRKCSSIMSEAIDIPSKWCDGTQRLRLTRSNRLLASLPAAAESREAKWTRGHVIAMLYSHVFLHSISLLKLSFCSPSHLYFITARPLYLSQSLLHLLPLVQPLSPSSLYHHFCLPSRLLSVYPDIFFF